MSTSTYLKIFSCVERGMKIDWLECEYCGDLAVIRFGRLVPHYHDFKECSPRIFARCRNSDRLITDQRRYIEIQNCRIDGNASITISGART